MTTGPYPFRTDHRIIAAVAVLTDYGAHSTSVRKIAALTGKSTSITVKSLLRIERRYGYVRYTKWKRCSVVYTERYE